MDVGVDPCDFRPVSIEEIQKRMNTVTEEFSEE
jgi:calcineurin-like phosphoesterase family protein